MKKRHNSVAEASTVSRARAQLVGDWLAKAKFRYLNKLLEQLFRRFVDAKLFANAMFCGCFVVVLDATKVEECRGSGLTGWRRNRMALEAKVITHWGWAITVAVEPMRPWRSDAEKQDCELGALGRIAPRLKRIFGRHGVIVTGDALYTCKAGLDTCRDRDGIVSSYSRRRGVRPRFSRRHSNS